ncbi:hypothetical protein BGZ76_007867 [Entomortierella beljakovae]|nr:hypothetical protein BGZ76_007867 [Entomortierella beljakovae]
MTGTTQQQQQEQGKGDSKQPLQLRSPLSVPLFRTDRTGSTATGYTIHPSGSSISIGTAVAASSSILLPPSITVASPTPLNESSSTVEALDLPFSPQSTVPSNSFSNTNYSLNSVPPHSTPSTNWTFTLTSTPSSSSSTNMTTAIATASAKSSSTSVSSTSLSPLSSPTASIHPKTDQSGSSSSRPTSMVLEEHQVHQSSRSIRSTNASSNGHGYDSASTSQRSSHETGGDSGPYDEDFGANISFVYANEKRFSDFHSLFRSVPDDEKLIEDYGCALQKEILVQGRLYISESHICFNANIFGWVTNLVIAFSEITAIEKRMTAFVIPNAIGIVTTTNTKGHFFASFLSRDAAHDLLMAAWRKAFPCAANASVAFTTGGVNGNTYYRQNRSNMTINDDEDSNDGQSFIAGKSDSRKNRHRRSFSNASQTWTGDESGEGKADYWAGEDADDKSGSGSLRRRGSKRGVKKILDVITSKQVDEEQRNGSLSPNSIPTKRTGRVRSVSELPPRPTSFDGANRDSIGTARSSFEDDSIPIQRPRAGTTLLNIPPSAAAAAAASAKRSTASSASTPTSSRTPTTCKCSKDGRHYPNSFMNETYPGSVQAMWKLLFDSEFNKSFLTSESMKGADVQEEAWQNTPDGKSTKTTRYTKWLGMPIGPKTTKAILTDVCEYKNFDDYTTTVTTTSTPDVPSGGSFTTKVRTCITWAGPNQVQVTVTGHVEFTKTSWIKGQIEKGAADGLGTHYKELNKSIRKHIASDPKNFGGSGSSNKSAAAPAAAPAEDRSKVKAPATPANTVDSTKEKIIPSSTAKTTATTKTSPLSDIISALSKVLSWNQNNAASQLAFVAVLVIVMVANFYLFLQISSVSSQIEKIQTEILNDYYQHNHHHQHSGNHYTSSGPSPAGSGRHADSHPPRASILDAFEQEEMFAQAQEEAMWAWLTEREARHRQYRMSNGFRYDHEQPRHSNGGAPKKQAQEQNQQQQQRQPGNMADAEDKLQSRINELQEQLAALEKQTSQIKIDVNAAENEASAAF